MYLYFKIFNEPTILFLDVWYKKWYFFNSLPIRELDSESSYLNGHVGRSKFTKFSWALSLNTQSCIKGFFGVRDSWFWAVWASTEKNVVGLSWADSKIWVYKYIQNKGLLLQDWVFILGLGFIVPDI